MKKKVSLSLILVLILSMLAGCGGDKPTTPAATGDQAPAATGEPIKIGGLAPLTGSVAVYGTANQNGANLAFKEINAAGGILDGRLIEFNTLDEKGDTTEAVNGFNKLMGQGVVALLGDVTSKPTLAVADEAATAGLPMITATATAAAVTDAGDNIFRVCFLDPFQGMTMANFAADNLGAKTAAVLYNTGDDYSQGLAQAFKETAEAKGITVTSFEGYGEDDKDFKSQLTSINQKKPDVIFLPDYYAKVALIAAQVKEIGCEAIMLGGDGWDGVLTTVASPEVVEGAYFCNHYSIDDPNEKTQAFVKNYEATYNEKPNSFAALAYDTAYILADAIDRAGSTESEAIIKALAETSYEGVTGKITFNEKGDPIKEAAILKIVDGVYTSDTGATADTGAAAKE